MAEEDTAEKERKAKQLQTVVCICKGIKLAQVLKGLKMGNTVEEVNKLTGCGSGPCQGQRCGPRIEILLKKKAAMSKVE